MDKQVTPEVAGNDKQITIPYGKDYKVVTEVEVRDVQERLDIGYELCRHDKVLLDGILSYFRMNVIGEAENPNI